MSLNAIKSMLSTLIQYRNCEIIHTFSEEQIRLIEVRYVEEINGFKLINLLTEEEIICTNIEKATMIIYNQIERYKNQTNGEKCIH